MTPLPPDFSVHDDADLSALWHTLIGPGEFGQRTLWLTFLDQDGRVSPLIVPIDDIPTEPDALFARNIARIIDKLVAGGDTSSVALLLSRPGVNDMTALDRRWARALHAELGPELSRWPIHLATCDNIRVFAPDDLLGAA